MNTFSKKSQEQFFTCHPDLQTIARAVLQIHDCSFIQGHRDKETQDKYYANKTSHVQYPNSKHNTLPSMAMDLAPYKKGDNTYDMENVLFFSGIVITVAKLLLQEGVISHQLMWGGNWSVKADHKFAFDRDGFYDGIHFELVL